MKVQILKTLALLNAASYALATTATGTPAISNLNRAHGTNVRSIMHQSILFILFVFLLCRPMAYWLFPAFARLLDGTLLRFRNLIPIVFFKI